MVNRSWSSWIDYDDDTYELLNNHEASYYLKHDQISKDSPIIDKVEYLLDQRKQKRNKNAIKFLEELNKKKKKIIV